MSTEDRFAAWMLRVDFHLSQVGVHHLDLPDFAYRASFDRGVRPATAARAALRAAGSF